MMYENTPKLTTALKILYVPIAIGFIILSSLMCTAMKREPRNIHAAGLPLADGEYLLTEARFIDGTGCLLQGKDSLRISAGIIHEIGRDLEKKFPNLPKISCRGLTITPGFINTHVHNAYDADQLERWAQAGILVVRDMNPRIPEYASVRDQLGEKVEYADIISASPMFRVPGGYGSGRAVVNSLQEARDKIIREAESGADVIKIAFETELPPGTYYKPMRMDIAAEIVRTAYSKGLNISAHATRDRDAYKAISIGAKDIAHMTVDRLSEKTLQLAKERMVTWVPTLELWEKVGWGEQARKNLQIVHSAGIPIALGTDFGGYSVNFDKYFPMTEIRAMRKAGMSAQEIIASGTSIAAKVCGINHCTGRIQTGMRADLVGFPGDPLSNLEYLDMAVFVIHRGKIIKNQTNPFVERDKNNGGLE